MLPENVTEPQVRLVGTESHTFTYDDDNDIESDLTIHNYSGSDILFTGLVDDRPGMIVVTNEGGDILSSSSAAILQAARLRMESRGGDVGTAQDRINIELFQKNDEQTEFWLIADGSVYADITGNSYQDASFTSSPFVSHARELTGSGVVDVDFLQGSVTTFALAPDRTTIDFSRVDGSAIDLEPTAGANDGYSIVTDLFDPALVTLSTFDPDAALDTAQFDVNASGNQIDFGFDHGLTTGQAVQYDSNGSTDLGGLIGGETYYVVRISDQVIELARTQQEALGTSFDSSAIDASANTITLSYDHGFSDGAVVLYRTTGAAIPGLIAGTRYFVDSDSGDTASLRLAKSLQEAQGATFTSGFDDGDGASAAGAVDDAANTITFGYQHGFEVGDTVVYSVSGTDEAIGGLVSGQSYTVATATAFSISLEDGSGNVIDLVLPIAEGTTHRIALSIDTTGLPATDEHTLTLVIDHAPATQGSSQLLTSLESIDFGSDHAFVQGQAVIYTDPGTGTITGLTNGAVYYVVVVDSTTIKLAASLADADAAEPVAVAFDLISASGPGHSFSSARVIELGYDHGYFTGDRVAYDSGTGTSIGNLTQAGRYYIIVESSTSIRLAASRQDALDEIALVVNPYAARNDLDQHSLGLYFDPTSVDGGLDIIDFESSHRLNNGDRVVFRNAGLSPETVGDLVEGTEYFVAVVDGGRIKLTESLAEVAAVATPLELLFVKADLGSSSSAPLIEVDDRTITITINTNDAQQTTALDLANAVNSEIADLVTVSVTGPDSLVLSDQFFGDGLTLSGVSAESSVDGFEFRGVNIGEPLEADVTYVIEGGGRGVGQLSLEDVADNSITDFVLNGALNYAAGSVTIVAEGSITSTGAGQLIQAGDIQLDSTSGRVGDATQSIRIAQSGGQLDVSSAASVYVTAVSGDMRLGQVVSTGGGDVFLSSNAAILDATADLTVDVFGANVSFDAVSFIGESGNSIETISGTLGATAGSHININELADAGQAGDLGEMLLLSIDSSGGNVNLQADGSITDLNDDSLANISAADISLLSRNGAIGSVGNDLDLAGRPGGIVDARAEGDVYLTETDGDMIVFQASSQAGAIRLRAPDDFKLLAGGAIFAAGDVTIIGDYAEGADGDVGVGTTIEIIGTLSADTVHIFGGDDDDSIGIVNLLAQTNLSTLDAGAGDDRIFLGRSVTGDPADGSLSGIESALRIDGGPHGSGDSLFLDDSNSGTDRSGTITGDTITGFGLGAEVTYVRIENLDLELGSGVDTVNIRATANGTVTTIYGNDGGDVFNISSDAPTNLGTLDGILGELFIEAGAGANALAISDAGELDGEVITITRDSVTGLAPSVIHFSGTFTGGLSITTGQGDDDITVASLPADGTTTVRANAGNDLITIEATATEGDLAAYGDAGNDILNAAAVGVPVALFGGDGRDILLGGSAGDVLEGGAGNDVLVGDGGTVTPGKQGRTIVETVATTGGDDFLAGGAGNDVVIGGPGDDTVSGNLSQDLILGDTGRVVLRAGDASVVRVFADPLEAIAAAQFGLYTGRSDISASVSSIVLRSSQVSGASTSVAVALDSLLPAADARGVHDDEISVGLPPLGPGPDASAPAVDEVQELALLEDGPAPMHVLSVGSLFDASVFSRDRSAYGRARPEANLRAELPENAAAGETQDAELMALAAALACWKVTPHEAPESRRKIRTDIERGPKKRRVLHWDDECATLVDQQVKHCEGAWHTDFKLTTLNGDQA